MALTCIDDLLEIEKRISLVETERTALACRLKEAQQAAESSTGEEYVDAIARDISDNATSAEQVRYLRKKYGSLEVLDKLEAMFSQEEAVAASLRELDRLNERIGRQDGSTPFAELEETSRALTAVRECLGERPEAYVVFGEFDHVLSQRATALADGFKQALLESKWDTPTALSSSTVSELKERSTSLYKLGQLVINKEDNQMWNFQCIANNFQMRFTYHFHDSSFKIETYFKYLNDYLSKNLYKCINIFHDEPSGLSKQVVHEQFINHTLHIIREKVETCLLRNDTKVLISLISQILKTDKNLETSFHYHGTGLISLVPSDVWDIWLSYETETATAQFNKLTGDSETMAESSSDFIKLLNKIYSYLKPFYGLEFEPLKRYKLLSCSQIFINLSSQYLDYMLTVNSLGDAHTEEEQLFQTLLKLQNIENVYRKISELSQEYIFVYLTDVVNERESKKYSSLFQNVLEEYRKVIEESIQPTIIHRIKKLLKESLRNYFKISLWSVSSNQAPTTTNSELVNAIKLMTRIVLKLDRLNISLAVSLAIKNELLNILVNYFIESILKLNKFSQHGLQQFSLDFLAMKDSLSLPDDNSNIQESVLHDLVKVLSLKYDENGQKFYDISYIKESNYEALREHLSVKSLSESEIQDALYRIAYGNIL